MTEVKLFRALGDPTRIEIVKRLSSGDSYTITSVSKGLDITRQGARKHLQILEDAEIIHLEPIGRDTFVHLDRDALEKGKMFIEKMERQWDARLNALKRHVEGKAMEKALRK